jgi:hypothetical protein
MSIDEKLSLQPRLVEAPQSRNRMDFALSLCNPVSQPNRNNFDALTVQGTKTPLEL